MEKGSQLRKLLIGLIVLESQVLSVQCVNAEMINCNNVKNYCNTCEQNMRENSESNKTYFLSYNSTHDISRGINSKQNEVVRYAYKLLGKPYVYGATGPNEFDCSGLTQYVYNRAGTNISRTTYTQVEEGVEVRKCDLIPGDLVFFNTKGYMSHVGIYIGDGSFIHAPRTGKPVMISSLNEGYYCEKYATARRILN